ncbi:hypothetical protein ACWEQD_12540 [Rhodococcus pyridinivorans]
MAQHRQCVAHQWRCRTFKTRAGHGESAGRNYGRVSNAQRFADDRQHDFARWCVHQAWERAGLVRSSWFRDRLAEMDAGYRAHPHFIASTHARNRIDADPQIRLMVVGGDTDDMGGDEAIATRRVRQGVPVAYRGRDTDRDILNPQRQPPMLFHGHPGRITSPAMQHILVDWVGLEDEPASFAVGYCPHTIDGGWAGPVVPALAEISEDEYLLRKQRIDKGERPIP